MNYGYSEIALSLRRVNTEFEGKNYVLLLLPYDPIAYEKGCAEIDAYYFASNALYHAAEEIVNRFESRGERLRRAEDVNLKALLFQSGQADVGRNTLCMTKEFGSRFVIGAFESDVPIKQETGKAEKICTNCLKCVKACPTGALDHGFDRTLCIRWQMETRSLSDAASAACGARLLGCDICQRACPQNRNRWVPADEELTRLLRVETLFQNLKENRLDDTRQAIGANYARARRLYYMLANVMGCSGKKDYLSLLREIPAESAAEKLNKDRAIEKLCNN